MTLHNRLPLVQTSLACILMTTISMVAVPHTPAHAASAAHLATGRTLTRPSLRGPIVDGANDNSNSCADTYIAIGGAGTTSGLAHVYLSIWSHNGAIKNTRATVQLRNTDSGYLTGFSATGPGNGLNGTQYSTEADVYTGSGVVSAWLTGSITVNNGFTCTIPAVIADETIS